MEVKTWTLITGATGAMGAAAVEALASQGVPVLLACRNRAKGEALIRDIRSRIPEARLEIRELELSSMDSLSCRFAKLSAASLQPGADRFTQLGTYARGKRALLSFSMELARRYPELTVNVADPGVVSSGMIDLGRWFDPLADALFKPLCSSPQKGVHAALRALEATEGPRYYVGKKQAPIPRRYQTPGLDQELWERTEQMIGGFFAPGSC